MKTMNKTYSPNKTTEKLMKKQLYKPANNITSQTYKTKFNQLFTKINTKMEEITMTKNINNKHTLNFVQQYNFKIIVTPNNYPERNIKNTPIEEINTRNHYSLANKPLQQEIKPVKCNTSTVKQRALRITKTEVSRAQNTAILQTYANEGYTEVTILTAEDQHVCRLCLANAYQFNKDSEMVYHEDLKDRTHRISDLDEDSRLPLHPNCRCTYLSVWDSKKDVNSEPDVVNLTPFHDLSNLRNIPQNYFELKEKDIPETIPKSIHNQMMELDKITENTKIEHGYLANLTTGEIGNIVKGEEGTVDLSKSKINVDAGEKIVASHIHTSRQPFNHKDFESFLYPKQNIQPTYMIVHTKEDVFIAKFSKDAFNHKKEILNGVIKEYGTGQFGNGAFHNNIWSNYINNKILNKYITFTRIRK